MKQTKQNTYPFSQQWVEEMVRIIQDTAESQGIKPALSYLWNRWGVWGGVRRVTSRQVEKVLLQDRFCLTHPDGRI